jgi:hypothetical protein
MSRLRLIAGPNGSGKSSIFLLIKEFKEKQKVIPTGPFINSDLIEKEFRDKGYIDLKFFGVDSPPSPDLVTKRKPLFSAGAFLCFYYDIWGER